MIDHGSPPERRGADPTSKQGVVGILALQGSFHLHRKALERLGAPTRLVRRPGHLDGLSAEPYIFILATGSLEVFRVGEDGVETRLSVVLPGEPIGEIGYFSNGQRSGSAARKRLSLPPLSTNSTPP